MNENSTEFEAMEPDGDEKELVSELDGEFDEEWEAVCE